MNIQKLLGFLILLSVMVVTTGCVYPTPPENVSVNTYGQMTASGLVIPGAVPTAPPLLVIGSLTVDLAQTPAVYQEGTLPLQAVYREFDPETGRLTKEVIDSNTNCGAFNQAADTANPDVTLGTGSRFCTGVGAQDLGIGLGAGASGQ